MKTSHKLLVALALLCTGCDSETKVAAKARPVAIDADDVAWATDWSIFKWRLGALTSEPVRSIQIVVVGSDGGVIREAASVGYSELLEQNKHVTIAFKKEASFVSVRLRYGGSSVSTKLEGFFEGPNWGTSGEFGVAGDLVAVATNANQMPATTEALLKLPGDKLCLRLITQETNEAEQDEAEQDGAGQPATRSESS